MSEKEQEQYEKTGYLMEPFRAFHIRDHRKMEFDFHYHDFYKIIYFVEGKVVYQIEGKSYRLKPHDFVLVGANVIHRAQIDESFPYERYVIYLSEDFLSQKSVSGESLKHCFDQAQKNQNWVLHFTPESYEDMVGCLLKMRRMERQKNAPYHDFLLQAVFLEFMVLLNRNVLQQPKAFIETAVYHEKVVDVIAYIQEHLAEEISIDILAEKFYISKYYLMRQFRQATGYSVHKYLNEKRIQAARQMILSGIPASTACYECGFKDYSTFAKRFKQIVGTAPSKLGG